MKKEILLLLLATVFFEAAAQPVVPKPSPYPWVWTGGFQDNPELDYRNVIFFTPDTNIFNFRAGGWLDYVNFEATATSLSLYPEILQIHTNGCRIFTDGQEVIGSRHLNPGEVTDLVCPFYGYIVPQGVMFLPIANKTQHYYLIHMGARFDPVRKLLLSPLYYTLFQSSSIYGTTSSKNNILLDGDLGSFHTIRHGNGRDWWIIVPDHGNRRWHTLLATRDEIEVRPPQTIEGASGGCERHEATAVSADGALVANWGDCKVSLLRFDRCSGAFFDLREIPTPTHWVPGGGLAFSPSGRYLYATSHTALFRADLEQSPPSFDTLYYAYDPGLTSPYSVPGNTFFYMENTPDERIFIAAASRAKFYHVIGNPEGATRDAIGFKARGLALYADNVRTMPHFPNYRLLNWKGSPCDTLLQVGTRDVWGNTPFRVDISPNPASNHLQITDFSDRTDLPRQFNLLAPTGQRCFSATLKAGEATPLLLMPTLAPGIYFWELRRADGAHAGGKLMIQ